MAENNWDQWILEKNKAAEMESLSKSDKVKMGRELAEHPHQDTMNHLDALNEFTNAKYGPRHSSHFLMDDPKSAGAHAQPNDLAIYWDHGDSYHPDHAFKKNPQEFGKYMKLHQDLMDEHMAGKGYEKINHNDHSHDGVFYGVNLYRKKQG
jgi:hypothetical protein